MIDRKYTRFTKFRPAMEAEDISASAQQNQKSLLGPTANNRNDEEDNVENTSDILGTKEDSKDASEAPLTNNNEDSNNVGETTKSNNTENEEVDDSVEENSSDSVDLLTPDETEINVKRKTNLRRNMILLFNTIKGNIQILKNNILSSTKKEDIQVINSIIENLENANQVLYTAITVDYVNTAYAELLKKYQGAQKVYDISILMVYKHFDNLQKEANGKRLKQRDRK